MSQIDSGIGLPVYDSRRASASVRRLTPAAIARSTGARPAPPRARHAPSFTAAAAAATAASTSDCDADGTVASSSSFAGLTSSSGGGAPGVGARNAPSM